MTDNPHGTPLHDRDPDDLLLMPEVAEILRTSINTLRWWRQQGTGPQFFKMGRNLVTTVEDVRQYVHRQRLGDTVRGAESRPATA